MKKVLLGIAIGILIAPKKGSELRQDIKEGVLNTYNSIKDMDADDFKAKISEVKESIADFDFNETKDMVVKKANEFKDKVDEFVASEKVQKTYETVKEKTTEVASKASELTNQVVEKASDFATRSGRRDTLAEEIELELAMDDVTE